MDGWKTALRSARAALFDAVGADHEVELVRHVIQRWSLGQEVQLRSQARCPLLEDLQKALAAQRRKAVTAGGAPLATVEDVDLTPAREASDDLAIS